MQDRTLPKFASQTFEATIKAGFEPEATNDPEIAMGTV
jgi:hypothetical protein